MTRRIHRPTARPLDAVVASVPSKSMTHRALIAAALGSGPSHVHDPLDADDTRATLDGLRALGFDVAREGSVWTVIGRGGEVPGGGRLDLGESGTSFRLLLAVAALGRRASWLDGRGRLADRPIDELVGALCALGADIRLPGEGRSLPMQVGGRPLRQSVDGARVTVSGGRSSQFTSALLMIGSRLQGGLELNVEPPVVSSPYVDLTVEVLRHFGVPVDGSPPHRYRVSETVYQGTEFRVEGDHSSASYFLAAAAVAGGRVRVDGVDGGSRQADARLSRILRQAGCRVEQGAGWIEVQAQPPLRGFRVDLTEAPDLAPTVAVVAMFADGPSTLEGLGHLPLKESDRLGQIAANLRLLGCDADPSGDRLEIRPSPPYRASTVQTASDHRLAMAFAVAGLRIDGLTVDDADCVAKSNPGFWSQFDAMAGI